MSDNISVAPSPLHLAAWRPIETAPKGRRKYVLLIGQYPTGTGWSDVYHSWWDDCWARWPHSFPPTHWMPLPEPPGSDEPSAAAHETARHYSPNTEQVMAELCEALKRTTDHLESYADYAPNGRTAETDATIFCSRQALSKARGAAG